MVSLLSLIILIKCGGPHIYTTCQWQPQKATQKIQLGFFFGLFVGRGVINPLLDNQKFYKK